MTKLISLSKAAYANLLGFKEENESFSDVILKITKDKIRKPLTEFAGKWKGSKEETKEIFDGIIKNRSKNSLREIDM